MFTIKVVLVSQALHSLSSALLLLPRPDGPYGTNVAIAGLTDHSRLDPFAPTPENRSMVISIFHPVAPAHECVWETIPAYPKATTEQFDAETASDGVPKGSFERIHLEVCSAVRQSAATANKAALSDAPIVLFSPGLGISRLLYSALAQSVASFGFNVITIDTPYDTDIVEFPDGQTIRMNPEYTTMNNSEALVDVRVRAQDMSFILDQLSKPNFINELFYNSSPSSPRSGLATDRVGIFGHSIGGAAAAEAMYLDDRFVAGVNLDGGLYGPVIQHGLKNLFLLFSHEQTGRNSNTRSWRNIWPHLNWKLELELLHSTHQTFTDLPLLVDLFFGPPLPRPVEKLVGSIDGRRARSTITAYIVAVMNKVLKCDEPQPLLQGPSSEYPAVRFITTPGSY